MPKYIAHKETGYCVRIGNGRPSPPYFMTSGYDHEIKGSLGIQVFDTRARALEAYSGLLPEVQAVSAVVPVEISTQS